MNEHSYNENPNYIVRVTFKKAIGSSEFQTPDILTLVKNFAYLMEKNEINCTSVVSAIACSYIAEAFGISLLRLSRLARHSLT